MEYDICYEVVKQLELMTDLVEAMTPDDAMSKAMTRDAIARSRELLEAVTQ